MKSDFNVFDLFCFISFFLSFFMLAVDAQFGSAREKEKGPDPKLSLVVQPQPNVIIPLDSFAWLHCSASTLEPDHDYANDDPNALMDDWQFPTADDYEQSDSPNSVDSEASISDYSGFSCKQEVQYQWLRNGEPIDSVDDSITETFCNGSIKIKYSTAAEGVYRCFAETTQSDDGAIVSKAATVKLAGMYYLLRCLRRCQNEGIKILIFSSV